MRTSVILLALTAWLVGCKQAEDTDNGPECLDLDGDGAVASAMCSEPWDCDDSDPNVSTLTEEIADNGIDDDCDGSDDLTVLYVATDGSDNSPGTMEAPMQTLEAALTRAVDREIESVHLAEGTYVAGVYVLVNIEGGFSRATWERDVELYPTILDGEGETALWRSSSVSEERTVSGVRVRGGVFTSGAASEGALVLRDVVLDGGIYGTDASAPVLLDRVVSTGSITKHHSRVELMDSVIAGGISGEALELEALRSVIEGRVWMRDGDNLCDGDISESEILGGIEMECSGSLDVVDSLIRGAGHAIETPYMEIWQVRIARSTLEVRGAEEWCGGVGGTPIYSAGSTLEVLNSRIVVDAPAIGHGVRCPLGTCRVVGSSIHVRAPTAAAVAVNGSTTLIGNVLHAESTEDALGATVRGIGTVTAHGNAWTPASCVMRIGDEESCVPTAEIDACAWSGCSAATASVFDVDTGFFDPAIGDLRLWEASPLRDAGIDPATVGFTDPLLLFDFEGDPRPSGSAWDIGADEWTADPVPPDPPDPPDPTDLDGDGVQATAGDCDDTNPLVHPGAVELCDGIDNDCDGEITDEDGMASWRGPLGDWSDVSATLQGSHNYDPDEPGDLYLCAGVFDASVTIDESMRIHGAGTGLTTLTRPGSSVAISAYPSWAGTVEDLTLSGVGIDSWRERLVLRRVDIEDVAGTAVETEGALVAEDMVVRNSTRGFHVHDGSAVLTRVEIMGATDSAIMVREPASLHLIDCDLHDNDGDRGGAVQTDLDVVILLEDTRIHDNSANNGGGLFLTQESIATCRSSAPGRGGFWRNTAAVNVTSGRVHGSAVHMYFSDGSFVSEGCDLGEGVDDNDADEIFCGNWSGWHGYGADTWVTCGSLAGGGCVPAP